MIIVKVQNPVNKIMSVNEKIKKNTKTLYGAQINQTDNCKYNIILWQPTLNRINLRNKRLPHNNFGSRSTL